MAATFSLCCLADLHHFTYHNMWKPMQHFPLSIYWNDGYISHPRQNSSFGWAALKDYFHQSSASFCVSKKFLLATSNGITHIFNAYVTQISMLTCCVDTSKSRRLLSPSTDTVSCISSTHWVLSRFISRMWLVNMFEHLARGNRSYLEYIHCLLAGTA